MKPNTSVLVTSAGGLPTTLKNTFKSKAVANTVFGRHRPATNSRYSSSSGTPSRTSGKPLASTELIRRGSTAMGALHLHERRATTARRNVHEDHPHIKHERMTAQGQSEGIAAELAARNWQSDRIN